MPISLCGTRRTKNGTWAPKMTQTSSPSIAPRGINPIKPSFVGGGRFHSTGFVFSGYKGLTKGGKEAGFGRDV